MTGGSGRLVANARMYSVAPGAAAAWKRLFGWLSAQTGIALEIVDHAFPAPLGALWRRDDLGCAFMCGYPYLHAAPRPQALAAPVPLRSAGRPIYVTDFVVRADSGFATLSDTFGGRLGYTTGDSHSGFNAVRHHLLRFRSAARPKLYARSIGPLHTPRRVIDALLAGDIDVGPLDGYALDLLRRHDPALAAALKVVDTTEPAPAPLLVASASCPDAVAARFASSLAAFGEDPGCAALRNDLCLAGFAPVDIADYEVILAWEREALAAGYDRPE